MYFWGGYAPLLRGRIPQEEWDTGVGRSSSIQTVGSTQRTPWLAKPARKNKQKASLANSLQWKNVLKYFWLNAFGRGINSINLSTTIFFNSISQFRWSQAFLENTIFCFTKKSAILVNLKKIFNEKEYFNWYKDFKLPLSECVAFLKSISMSWPWENALVCDIEVWCHWKRTFYSDAWTNL